MFKETKRELNSYLIPSFLYERKAFLFIESNEQKW